MKASDLDRFQKKRLLESIKENLGDDGYTELVEVVGEEGLLDMALRQATHEQAKKEKEAKDTQTTLLFFGGLLTVAIIGAIVVAVGGYRDSGLKGMAIGAITGFFTTGMYAFTVCHFLFLIIDLFSNLKAVGVVVASILGLGFLGVLLYGLWKVVAFAGSGTVSWFQWLFGKF